MKTRFLTLASLVLFALPVLAQPAVTTPTQPPAAPAATGAEQGSPDGGAPLQVGGDAAEVEAEKDPFNLLVQEINLTPGGATPGSKAEVEMLKVAETTNLPEAYFNLGVLYVRAGMLDRAWGFFEKATQASNTFCEGIALQGYIEGLRGRTTEATVLLDKAIAMNKYCAPARNYYAKKALSDGNYDEAIRHCRIALLGDPGNTNIYLNLGFAYFRKGNLELAEFVIREGLSVNASKAALLNLRGLVALKKNDVRGAFRAFEEAFKADGTYVDALKNLAAMELNYKAFDAALLRIDEVLEREPGNLMFRISRAVALRGLGRLDESKALMDLLVKENPTSFEVAYNDCILHKEHIKNLDSSLPRCQRALGLVQKGHPKFVELSKRVKSIQADIKALQEAPPDVPPTPPSGGTPAAPGTPPDGAPAMAPEGAATPAPATPAEPAAPAEPEKKSDTPAPEKSDGKTERTPGTF